MPMWTSFCHLIWQSLVYFPTILSSNWLSIFLPVVVTLPFEFVHWKDWRAMKWREIGGRTKFLAFAYLLLFGWAIIRTVYQDHEYLSAALRHETDTAKADPRVSVKWTMSGATGNGKFLTAVGIQVINNGPDMAFTDWNLALKTKSGLSPKGIFLLIPMGGPEGKFRSGIAKGAKAYLDPEANCGTVMINSISTNGYKDCWIWMAFDISPEQMDKDWPPTLTLHFANTLGKKFQFSWIMQNGNENYN